MNERQQTFLLRWSYLYVLSIGFQTLLPWHFQVSELIFSAGFLFLAVNRINIFSVRTATFDRLLLFFIVFSGAISLFSFSSEVLLQVATHVYLLLLFFIIRYLYFVLGDKFVATLKRAFAWSGVLVSVSGILGVLLYYLTGKLFLADVYYDYPYFGTVVRAMGFTTSPSMLVGITGVALSVSAEEILKRKSITRREIFMVSILVTGLFASVSKDCVLFSAGIFFLAGMYAEKKVMRVGLMCVGSLVAVVLLVSTHFAFSPQSQKESLYTPEGDKMAFGQIHVAETGYSYLKHVAYTIGKEHWLTGIGEGNFKSELHAMRAKGVFSARMPDYDPHSTFFGAFAETGIFGCMFLCVVVICLLLLIRTKMHVLKETSTTFIGVLLLLICYNAIWADVLNYRHLWVLLGIFSGLITFSGKCPSPAPLI